jgi:hypothetical protein
MIRVNQSELIEKFAGIHQLSPDVRFGHLLANLGFLVEDQTEQSLWDVDDAQLLEVIEKHCADLRRRLRADERQDWATQLLRSATSDTL